MNLRTLFWAATAILAACFAACDGDNARKPDVVVILIDTLRPDHLPMYGYQHATTPYLAEIAAHGVVFERAHSASTWTAPATGSLFTGLYPNQHGITEGFFAHMLRVARQEHEAARSKPKPAPGDPEVAPADDGADTGADTGADSGASEAEGRWRGPRASTVSINRIPEGLATLPERFARAGYDTFGASANVNITSRMRFDRGFARFDDFTGPEHGKGAAAEVVFEAVRTWSAQRSTDAPYFMYLHFNDVHTPYRVREPIREPGAEPFAVERATYDAELRYLDDVLRRIGQELKWDENTLICVVSDHGEEFGEHGGEGHGYTVHAEVMRIALMFSWPAQLPGGRRIETPVSIIDVTPTLTQLARVDASGPFAGISLASALAGGKALPERTLFALLFRDGGAQQFWAAQRGPWKLIVGPDSLGLYDHSNDPFEQKNLADLRPDVVEVLTRELDAFRALEPASLGARLDVELDAQALETLRTLGYTDSK